MDVRVIQTCDPWRYQPMLEVTGRASRRMCELHGLEYSEFIGLKIGRHPWHAVYNRIFLLLDIAESGFDGWVIYLDADSYPFDLSFDVRGYLRGHGQYGLIGAQCQVDQLLPNSGILLLNFGDPRTREIVLAWRRMFEMVYPGGAVPDALEWPRGVKGDQALLHDVLLARGDVERVVKFESPRVIGDIDATFLRQILRRFGDFAWRVEEARSGVAVALMMAGVWARRA